jgi:hypothetical protein
VKSEFGHQVRETGAFGTPGMGVCQIEGRTRYLVGLQLIKETIGSEVEGAKRRKFKCRGSA